MLLSVQTFAWVRENGDTDLTPTEDEFQLELSPWPRSPEPKQKFGERATFLCPRLDIESSALIRLESDLGVYHGFV